MRFSTSRRSIMAIWVEHFCWRHTLINNGMGRGACLVRVVADHLRRYQRAAQEAFSGNPYDCRYRIRCRYTALCCAVATGGKAGIAVLPRALARHVHALVPVVDGPVTRRSQAAGKVKV